MLGQLVYFWTNIRLLEGEDMFLEFANQIACTGFCTVGLLKLFMLSYHRNLLAGMLAELAAWWNEKVSTGKRGESVPQVGYRFKRNEISLFDLKWISINLSDF